MFDRPPIIGTVNPETGLIEITPEEWARFMEWCEMIADQL